MSKNWVTSLLEKSCNIEYGTRVVKKRDAGSIYPVYGGGGATFAMDTFNRENRMVIARFGMSEQCTRFVKDKFFLNDSGLTISPIKQDSILEEFLNYQIFALNDSIYSLGRGTAQKNLNVDKFKLLPISYPYDLNQQKQIVEILDKAFESIDKAKENIEKNIENTKELFQSRLNEIFSHKGEGWEEKDLSKISKIMYGYTAKSKGSGNAKYLRITDIQNNSVNWENVPYCELEDNNFLKYELQKGDIVFARTGATTGKSFLIEDAPKSVFASYLIRVQLNEEHLLPNFLYLFFQSSYYWSEINQGMSGSAQGGFNAKKLGALRISYPKEEHVQQDIIEEFNTFYEQTKQLEKHYQQKLANLEELKKSILQKAFRAELI